MSQEFQSVGRRDPGGPLPLRLPIRDEWSRMQEESNDDDPFQNIPQQAAAEVRQLQPTSVAYVAPAAAAAPVVPETPLVIAARKVEVTKADHSAAKLALEHARAACTAAEQRVEATLEASQFAKKELRDLVAESIGA
jgi:hypothetical protein